MSYTEINSKYISKTRKPHSCEWCGTQVEVGSEAWYRFYELDGDTHSAWKHPECARACDKANADPQQDLRDGWQAGDYDRGEYVSREDFRYPRRSTWEILQQVDEFAKVVAGDRVHSSIAPDEVRIVEHIGSIVVFFTIGGTLHSLDRDEWVLDDWCKLEATDGKD